MYVHLYMYLWHAWEDSWTARSILSCSLTKIGFSPYTQSERIIEVISPLVHATLWKHAVTTKVSFAISTSTCTYMYMYMYVPVYPCFEFSVHSIGGTREQQVGCSVLVWWAASVSHWKDFTCWCEHTQTIYNYMYTMHSQFVQFSISYSLHWSTVHVHVHVSFTWHSTNFIYMYTCTVHIHVRFGNHPITIIRANDKYTNAATIYTHTHTRATML